MASKPILCFLIHAWRFVEAKSSTAKKTVRCARCGDYKVFPIAQ